MAKTKRWGKKRKYSRNWKQYNEHLIKRGEYFVNPRFLETWIDEINHLNHGKVGQPFMYPDSMIQFLAILYAKGFDYRALQGIVKALSKRLGNFPAISFSQIRRRMKNLPLDFPKNAENLIVGFDGTGLKVGNRGEWIRQVWKIRRGWIKVVILGDDKGNIVDIRIGNEKLDERSASRGMLRKNKKKIKKALGDGLHDCEDTFDLCRELGIEPGIKIRENANESGLGARPDEVRLYKEIGYKEWAKKKGYGMRWVATEGIFSAVKGIFGEGIRSHKTRNMYYEAKLKFWAYQKLRDLN